MFRVKAVHGRLLNGITQVSLIGPTRPKQATLRAVHNRLPNGFIEVPKWKALSRRARPRSLEMRFALLSLLYDPHLDRRYRTQSVRYRSGEISRCIRAPGHSRRGLRRSRRVSAHQIQILFLNDLAVTYRVNRYFFHLTSFTTIWRGIEIKSDNKLIVTVSAVRT